MYPKPCLLYPWINFGNLHSLISVVCKVNYKYHPCHQLSIILSREEIASTVLDVFGVACDPWGIVVERVEVKNLSVAREMIKSMAVEAKANREANEGQIWPSLPSFLPT